MITLITGSNGAGKTAYAVSELQKIAQGSQRPIFVLGIADLVVRHELLGPVESWTRRVAVPGFEEADEAQFTFPDGSLIVIDECQNIFRPRGVGSKVPDVVAAFEKHRHKGLDFWLITQHPNLLDANVRRLVGKHIHLRGNWLGRELCEWPEAVDPASKSERATAVREKYKLPKSAFSLYKSATVHIKQERRIPKMLYVVVLVGLVTIGLGYRMFDRIKTAMSGGEAAVLAAPAAAGGVPEGVGVSSVSNIVPGGAPGSTVADYVPRLRGRPESAPLYDSIRVVRAMPVVVGCISTRRKCSCYTEQGSDAGLDGAGCRAWLEERPFDPWRETVKEERFGGSAGARGDVGGAGLSPGVATSPTS